MESRFGGTAGSGARSRRLFAVVLAVAILAAACGSSGSDTATEDNAGASAAVEETTTTEATTTTAAEVEVAAEQEVAEDTASDSEEPAAEDETADVGAVSFTTLGTEVSLELGVPAEVFETPGFGVVGRAGALDPNSAGIMFMRPTGFATLESRNADFPLPLFTGTLDEWLTLPEITVTATSETTVSGFDATVVDLMIERSDDLLQECGPPPQDQCIFFASTPDPGDVAITVARTGQTIRYWEIDQGDELPIIAITAIPEGEDEFRELAEAAMATIVIGDPQPAPEPIVSLLAAGEHNFDSLGGMTLTLPEEAIVLEGTQCVLLQFPIEEFESGMIFGRIDQDVDGNPFDDDQAYFDSFDGQVSREETGRTIELFGTTLTEYAVEETGENTIVSSCAPIGEDVSGDVLAGFIGAGTEYVADADDGGFYLAGWTTINPDESERMLAIFDQIVDSLQTAGE